MATICRKILKYVVVSTPKPVVNIDIHNFETGIFNVSASIWQILRYQSLVILARLSKNQLQVGDFLPKLAIQHYLITVINILTIAMFPDILRVIGAAWAYSYQMHVNLTQKQHNTTYIDRGGRNWACGWDRSIDKLMHQCSRHTSRHNQSFRAYLYLRSVVPKASLLPNKLHLDCYCCCCVCVLLGTCLPGHRTLVFSGI